MNSKNLQIKLNAWPIVKNFKVSSLLRHLKGSVSKRNTLSVLALVAFTEMAQAQMQCRNIFEDENIFSPKASFQATEAYRTFLLKKFGAEIQDMRWRKEGLQNTFFEKLEQRARIQNPTNISSIGGIPLNFTKLVIPTLDASTKVYLNKAFGKNGNNLSPSERGTLRAQAKNVLKQDHYFQWLEKNKIANPKLKNQEGGFQVDRQDSHFIPVQNPKDSIGLFLSTLDVSGPTHLPWELSLIRTIKDLDPHLPAEMAESAQYILYLHKSEVALEYGLTPLETKAPRFGQASGWDWALNHNEAKSNLRILKSELIKRYAPLLPESSFNLLTEMVLKHDPILQELHSAARKSDKDHDELFVHFSYEKMEELRSLLQLPANQSVSDQAWMIQTLQRKAAQTLRPYDEALAIAFLEEGQSVSYLELKDIVNVGEAGQNSIQFLKFITAEIKKLHFWY